MQTVTTTYLLVGAIDKTIIFNPDSFKLFTALRSNIILRLISYILMVGVLVCIYNIVIS